MYFLNRLFRPEIFQGKHRSRNYFEGWYFKLIDNSGAHAFAIIPGVSYGDSDSDAHAFIQVINATNNKTYYFKFDISEFAFSEEEFSVSIGSNLFSKNALTLNLSNEQFSLTGTLAFSNIFPYPKTRFKPSIMGPYYFFPFMECFHDVINVQHDILGCLQVDGAETCFDGGVGYLEKDWGTSFPESWLWLQSNHFDKENASLMFSVARIPFLGRKFNGFISYLRTNEDFYLFASYTGAKLITFDFENKNSRIVIKDRKYTLKISGEYTQSGELIAPKNGLMTRKIKESISSNVEVELLDAKGNLLFKGCGEKVGMEIVSAD